MIINKAEEYHNDATTDGKPDNNADNQKYVILQLHKDNVWIMVN